MINYVLKAVVPLVSSSVALTIMLDWWVKVAPKLGLVGKDMNKPGNRIAVEAGGLWVILASVFGILLYIAIDNYVDRAPDAIPQLSIALTLLLAGLIGYFDDALGWKRGISPIKRVILTGPISLPLVAVKAGYSKVELPLVGVIDLGPLYSVLVVPAGIVGASNAFNMIAGYNGLEARQGLIILACVLLLSVYKGFTDVLYVVLPVIGAILVFYLRYNRFPARVFPGNSFTYGIGAFYASLSIYWNFEKYAMYSFTLYFIELLLFLRGLLNSVYKENFGVVLEDGSLLPPYKKSFSLTHIAIKLSIAMKGKCFEKDVVNIVNIMQVIMCSVGLIITILG